MLGMGVGLVAGACGDDDDTPVAASTASSAGTAAESPSCDLARSWTLTEMNPVDESDPVAVEGYWTGYLDYLTQARDAAPEAVRDQYALGATAVEALVPVLDKYGFDYERVMGEGTDAEKALVEAPSAEVQAAQVEVLRYEGEVCAAQQPQAADVSFETEAPGAYCEAIATNNEMVGQVFAAGVDPAEVREMMTSDEFEAAQDLALDNAPAAISDDVAVLDAYWREQQVPVWETYGYDLRTIMTEGTPLAREVVQSTAPEVRDHYARTLAYEEQVCGQ